MPRKTIFLLSAFAVMTGIWLSSCTDTAATDAAATAGTTTTTTAPAPAATAAAATPASQSGPSPKVAAPTFSPVPGTYAGAQTVTISTATSGAVIRYTTDGSTPTQSVGTVYSSSFAVATTETVMAIAYQQGKTDSGVTTAAYTIAGTVATPSFRPQAGTYATDQSVTINCATADAIIHYTTDGSTPTAAAAVYTIPIPVAGNGTNVTIKAMATDADSTISDSTESESAAATYTITYQAALPAFTPVAGTYSSDQSVAITCATPGAAIHYTADGSTPSSFSPTYAAPIPAAGNGTNLTIKALATAPRMADSAVANATYVVNSSQVSTPNFSLEPGTYASDQSVTISCATSGALIHYTTDATTPSSSSPAYVGPIPLAGNGTMSTIKAIATLEGMTSSAIASARYVISYPQASIPVFNPKAGTYSSDRSVAISCATSGARIHYTTDGSTPTGLSPIYAGPIAVSGNGTNETIKAVAIMADMASSGVGTATYVIYNKWQTLGTLGSGSNQFTYPTGVAVDGRGRIYIADYGNNRIVRMDDMSGAGWAAFGSHGSGANQFSYPNRIAVDAGGRIYVADMNNNRIVRMDDMSGAGWTAVGSFGSGANQFSNPAGVAIDSSGHVYVADSGNSRVVRMDDMSGAGWIELGAPGSDINQFKNPVGIAIDARGRVIVADYGNYRIVRVDDMSGKGWAALGGAGRAGHKGANQFDHPSGVTVDDGGRIYISDTVNSRVVRIDDMAGENWTTLGSSGGAVSQFKRPGAVAVDTSGQVYVSDDGNCRIARFILQ